MPDHEQQVELAKRVAAGDAQARKQMVAANLRLVVHRPGATGDRGVDMADLVQEGTFGSMGRRQAPTGSGGSLLDLRWPVIRQASQRAVQQHGRAHPNPSEVGEQIQRLSRPRRELGHSAGPVSGEGAHRRHRMTADQRESLEDVARSLHRWTSRSPWSRLDDSGAELVAPDDLDFATDIEHDTTAGARGDRAAPDLQRRAAPALRLQRGHPGVAAVDGGAPRRRSAAPRRAEEEALRRFRATPVRWPVPGRPTGEAQAGGQCEELQARPSSADG